MKDPIDILAERLARLEQEGHITQAQRQKATDKLAQAKSKRPPKPEPPTKPPKP